MDHSGVCMKRLSIAMVSLLAACAGDPEAPQKADLVLRGGTVWTMNPQQPEAEAVAVRDGSIVFVGSVAGVEDWIGEATEVVELGDGMLLPGFQDAHVHVLDGGMGLADCDLSAAADADEVLVTVADCAAADADSPWLRGGGFQLTSFPLGNPLAATLDEVVADRPVYLTSSDGHSAWINSKALELAGITAETPDPPAGRIERDARTREPTGTLRETAMGLVGQLLPARTQQERRDGLRRGLTVARSFGITAFQEAGADADNLEAFAALAAAGELTAHVSISLQGDPKGGLAQVPELVALRDRYHGQGLRVDSVKLYIDGVIEAQTAALLEPYVGMGDFAGYTEFETEDLRQLVVALDREGFQIHVHAIGDRAIREILDAIELARQRNGARDARHHLAHVQLWDPADIPRMRELEVVANFQPLWAWADPFITDLSEPFLGPERSRWLYPIHSLVESGARVAFGSDWDVSTMNPLPAIEVGMTRQDPDDQTSAPWLPQERVDLRTMLAGYTTGAAWVNFLERETGTLEVGKRADLVVLERDLAALEPHEISDVQVVMTVFDGRVVYRGSLDTG
jgi:predicted amidohydrolase YtcJ